ncbi:CG32551 [Drosophila busckii]|uniref:CG32551 n=1 Tax=Drosophila busckii TaxID=30019 RepID=A0A0M4ETS9_DROBS|nr:CG32551 [Drosophila busckii]
MNMTMCGHILCIPMSRDWIDVLARLLSNLDKACAMLGSLWWILLRTTFRNCMMYSLMVSKTMRKPYQEITE